MPPRPMDSPSMSIPSISSVRYGRIMDDTIQENEAKTSFSVESERTMASIYVDGETRMNPNPIRQSTQNFGLGLVSNTIFKQIYQQSIRILVGSLIAWIPGLVAIVCYNALTYPLYAYPTCFGVGLFWWSVWLSVSWVGIWICWLAAYIAPVALRLSLGVLAINFKRQIGYLEILQRHVAIFLWSILIWVTYLALVWLHFPGHQGIDSSLLDPLSSGSSSNSTSSSTASDSILGSLWGTSSSSSNAAAQQAANELANYSTNTNWLITFSRFFFGIALCSVLLLAQKLFIQSVANDFHEVTYNERIQIAKFHTSVLVTLYSHIKGLNYATVKSLLAERGEAGQIDQSFLRINAPSLKQDQPLRPGKKIDWLHFRNALSLNGRPKRTIISTSQPQTDDLAPPPITFTNPFSPEVIVEMSLENTNETKKLAQLIFDAFAIDLPSTNKQGIGRGVEGDSQQKGLTLSSIETVFESKQQAIRAFKMLDRDENDDCTWQEFLTVCLDIHKERICLLASMHDIDAAVARLDQITRGVWATMSCVIVAALSSVRFSTLIASLGTILLGLSWLISSTAQESLASIVWVFCKHPIDVGDLVVVPGLLSFASSSMTKDTIAALQGYTDGDTFEVEEVQLMSTILKTTTTSKHVQVSNYLLSQKPMINLRRSGPIEEPFTLSVKYDTSLEVVEKLRSDMCDWISGQCRDFRPGLDIMIDGLDDQSMLKLTFLIRYKSNWQDARLRSLRRNRWISALKQLLKQLNIHGPAYIANSSGTKPTSPQKIKMYNLMDKGEERENEQEQNSPLSSRTGTFSSHPQSTMKTIARSRLNEAIPPIANANLYTRHSSSTRQLEPVNVEGRHNNEEMVYRNRLNDLESGKYN